MSPELKLTSGSLDFFMSKDWSEFAGKWIAICNNQIVSSNKDLDKVIK